MEISLRSYMTAGVSLTAATAIAMTPLALPANERVTALPSVSTADVQLVVTTEEIEAFIANLQGALDDVTATVAGLVGIPGQTLADVIFGAAQLNNDLFNSLIAATTNPTLIGLLTALNFYSTTGLTQLATTVESANDTLVATLETTTNLLTSALTGSLQNVLIAVNNIVNDPLAFANYAGLLGAGVASGELLAFNGLEALQTAGNGLFTIGAIGLGGLEFQVNNLVTGFNTILSGIGAASGSGLVEAAISAVQGIVILPALSLFNVGVGVVQDVVGGAAVAFNTVVDGAQGITLAIGNALQSAIAAIGAAPLDPASYASALGALAIGGFGVFNTVATTAGGLAQIPLTVIGNLNTTFTGVLTNLSTQVGAALSNILVAAGLPADISDLPIQAAANLNTVITGLSNAVNDGLDFASGLITDSVDLALGVSDNLQTGVLDLLGNPVIPAPPIPVPPAAPPLEADQAAITTFSGERTASGSVERSGVVTENTSGQPTEQPPAAAADADATEEEQAADDGTSDEQPAETGGDEQTTDVVDDQADTQSTDTTEPTDTTGSSDAGKYGRTEKSGRTQKPVDTEKSDDAEKPGDTKSADTPKSEGSDSGSSGSEAA